MEKESFFSKMDKQTLRDIKEELAIPISNSGYRYYSFWRLIMQHKYKFLYWLRFIGMFLIVYDHLGPLRNPNWFFAKGIKYFSNTPLGIIQDFGAFSVCLFFIISVFCLNTSAEKGWAFIYNKFIKLIVTLFLSVLLFFFFNKVASILLGQTYWDQFSLNDWLKGSTMFCYLIGEDSVINGSLWFIFPLLFLDLITGLFYKIVKRNMLHLVIVVDLLFLVLILGKVIGLLGGKEFSSQMQWLIFMLLPLFGVLIRLLFNNKINLKFFLTVSCVNWILFLEGIRLFRSYYYTDEPYLISLMYALLLFGIFLGFEEKIVLPKIVIFFSDISFSVYLINMTFGGEIMSMIENKLPFTVCFIIAICFVFFISILFHKYVEIGLISKVKKK